MKKLIGEEVYVTNVQRDIELTDERINQILKSIQKKMVELYNIDFACVNEVKIVKQSELLNQLVQRIQSDLEKKDFLHSSAQWKQIAEILQRNQVAGFFQNLVFYNPKDDVLFLNRDIIRNNPEKITPICAHELAEKLLSTYILPTLETPVQVTVKLYAEARKANNAGKFYEYLNIYIDTVFTSVFKEGSCEAIALQTLRCMGYEASAWEKELQIGHSKCIGLLSYVENTRRSGDLLREGQMRQTYEKHRVQAIDEMKLIKRVLKGSQIIKAVSYHLGYPLAKTVLEKYGIEGLKLAIEKHPPLKSQYFRDPQTYQTDLETAMLANKWR